MCFFGIQMWKPNNRVILLGYHNILIVFLKGHYRFRSVFTECISIDVYAVIASVAIFISLWSLVFVFLYSLVIILIYLHPIFDRYADALIRVAINLGLMILSIDFQ